MGSFEYKNQVNGEFFAYLWVILLYLEFDRCHTAVKQEFESIFQAD